MGPLTLEPMPWFLKKGETWTAEQRRAQAEILERVVPLERRALEEIEAALAAVGGS